MSQKSQNDKVLMHLKTFGRITDIEAYEKHGIRRLSARIYDLKKLGHIIKSRLIKVNTRDGETQVAEYRLVQKGHQETLEL